MTKDKSMTVDRKLSPSTKKNITFANNGKGKEICLGKVAISQDKHIEKVMYVEGLGYNLMSVS